MQTKEIRCRAAASSLICLLSGSTISISATLLNATTGQCAAVSAGDALKKSAEQLEAAGKWNDAGDTYTKAAAAYEKEGNQLAQTAALTKSAAMYEKYADELLSGISTPVKTAVPAEAMPATAPAAIPKNVVPPAKVIKLAPLAPRPGYIVGRAIGDSGAAVPSFTISYSGFEDGKLATTGAGGLQENVGGDSQGSGGRYGVKVPPGAYRVSAYATYIFQGSTYHFEMEPLNPPARHDYDSLGLDKLGGGLVRDFALKMTAKKAGASEETETLYRFAYYGGVVNFSTGEYEAILGGGHTPGASVNSSYTPDSRLHVTLTPQGAMVDGTPGRVVEIDARLGDDGRYTFCRRGIYPGRYTATATLTTPTGETVPLRLSLTSSKIILHGSPDGYDMRQIAWKPSVTVDFQPNDLGPMPRFGVKPVTLFLGK